MIDRKKYDGNDPWMLRGRYRWMAECWVEGCDRQVDRQVAFSLYCRLHVWRTERYGDPLVTRLRPSAATCDEVEAFLAGTTGQVAWETVAHRLGMKPGTVQRALYRQDRDDLLARFVGYRGRRTA